MFALVMTAARCEPSPRCFSANQRPSNRLWLSPWNRDQVHPHVARPSVDNRSPYATYSDAKPRAFGSSRTTSQFPRFTRIRMGPAALLAAPGPVWAGTGPVPVHPGQRQPLAPALTPRRGAPYTRTFLCKCGLSFTVDTAARILMNRWGAGRQAGPSGRGGAAEH